MRTLLNESLPPHLDNPAFSQSGELPRIFSEAAVLSNSEPNLMEVGVDGTVTATPGASADPAPSAPGRGLATLQDDVGQLNESHAL